MPVRIGAGGGGQQGPSFEYQESVRRRLNLMMDATLGEMGNQPDVALSMAQDFTMTDDEIIRGAASAIGQVKVSQMARDLASSDPVYAYSYWNTIPKAMQEELTRAGYIPPSKEEVYPEERDGFFDWEIPFTSWTRGLVNWLPDDILGSWQGDGNITFTGAAGAAAQVVGFPARALQLGIGTGLEGFNKLQRNWNRVYRFQSEMTGNRGPLGILNMGGNWIQAGIMGDINNLGALTVWNRVSDGEEYVQEDNVIRAAEILGGDALDPVASYWSASMNPDMMSTSGKLWIARKITGGHSEAEIAEMLGLKVGTQEYNEFVVQLFDLQSEESFQQALGELSVGKVSFGRDLARSIGVYDNPNSTIDEYGIRIPGLGTVALGSLVSGGGDFAWTVFADPTNVIGSVATARKASMVFKLDDISDVANAVKVKAALRTGADAIFDQKTGQLIEVTSSKFRHLQAKVSRVDNVVELLTTTYRDSERLLADGKVVEARQLLGRFSNANPRLASIYQGMRSYLKDDPDAVRGLSGLFDLGDMPELVGPAGLEDQVWRYLVSDKGRTAIASSSVAGINPRYLAMPSMSNAQKWMMHRREWAWQELLDIKASGTSFLGENIEDLDGTLELMAHYRKVGDKAALSDLLDKGLEAHLRTVQGEGLNVDHLRKIAKTPVVGFLRAFLRHIPRSQGVLQISGTGVDEFSRLASQLYLAKVPQKLIDEYIGAWMIGTDAERTVLTQHLIGDLLVRTGALTQGGKYGDAAWRVWDENVARVMQHYTHVGGGDEFTYMGVRSRAGLFPTDFDYRVAVPRFREIARASTEMGLLRRMGMPVTGGMFDSKMRKYWVPLQLMRIGFIPRAAGEEMISFMLREGPKGYIAASLGRRASGYMVTHRLEKLNTPAMLIMGDTGLATVKVTDATRQSSLLAPITGFTRFLRTFASTTGKDLRYAAEGNLLNSYQGFRTLPKAEQTAKILEEIPRAVSMLSPAQKAVMRLDDYAWWWSNKTSIFLHQVASSRMSPFPSPEWLGQKLMGQAGFDNMVKAATELMTDPLVAGAHARLLGQAYSRYANLSMVEGAITLSPVDVGGGKIKWVKSRFNLSKYDERLNPATMIDGLDTGVASELAADIILQWGKDVEDIAQNPMGARIMRVLNRYLGGQRQAGLSRFASRNGINPARELYRQSLDAAVSNQAMLKQGALGWEVDDLLRLPGVGRAKAQAIADYLATARRRGYLNVTLDDLTEVKGVTQAMVDQWKAEGFGFHQFSGALDKANNEVARLTGLFDEVDRMGTPATSLLADYHQDWHRLSQGRREEIYRAMKRGDYDRALALLEDVPDGPAKRMLDAFIHDPEKDKNLIPLLTSPNLPVLTDADGVVRGVSWILSKQDLDDEMLAEIYSFLEPRFAYEVRGGRIVGFRPVTEVDPDVLAAADEFRNRALHLLGDNNGRRVMKPPPAGTKRVYFPVFQPTQAATVRRLFMESEDPATTFLEMIYHLADDRAISGEQARIIIEKLGLTQPLEADNIPLIEQAVREVVDSLTAVHESGGAANPLTLLGLSDYDRARRITESLRGWVDDAAKRQGIDIPLAPSIGQRVAYLDVADTITDADRAMMFADPDYYDTDNWPGLIMFRHDKASAAQPVDDITWREFQQVRVQSVSDDVSQPTLAEWQEMLPKHGVWPDYDADHPDALARLLDEAGITDPDLRGMYEEVLAQRLFHGSVRNVDELRPIPEAEVAEGTFRGNWFGPGLYTTSDADYAALYASTGFLHEVRDPEMITITWGDTTRLPGVVRLDLPMPETMTRQQIELFRQMLRERLEMGLEGGNLWRKQIDEETGETLADFIEFLWEDMDAGGHTSFRITGDLHHDLTEAIDRARDASRNIWQPEDGLAGVLVNNAFADAGIDVFHHDVVSIHSDAPHTIWLTPQNLVIESAIKPWKVAVEEYVLDLSDRAQALTYEQLAETYRSSFRVVNTWVGGGEAPFEAMQRMGRNAVDQLTDLLTVRNRPGIEGDDAFNNVVDSLVNLGFPSRVNDGTSFNRLDGFTDVTVKELPAKLYAPERVTPQELTWDHITRSVFDGAISPAIDAIFRSNFYLYSYAQARQQTRFVLESGLRTHILSMRAANKGTDPVSKMGWLDDELEEFLSISWRQASMTDDVINADDPMVMLARALNKEILTTADGAIDQAALKSMADDAQGAFNVLRRRQGKPAQQFTQEQWLRIRKDLTGRAGAYADWAETATQRALELVVPYIDDHNIRSQFQEYIGTIMPFWFAEEAFLKRWARGLYANPAMLRRGQLAMNGLRHMGVIRRDEQGDEYFVYPGSQLLFEAAAELSLPIFGNPYGAVVAGPLSTKTSYMFPGMSGEQAGSFQWGPMVAIPTQFIADNFPEFNSFRDAFLGDANQMRQGAMDHLLPGPLVTLYQAITRSGYDKEQLVSAQFSAMGMLAANDMLPSEQATEGEMQDFIARVEDTARLILAFRAAGSFVAGSGTVPIRWDQMDIHEDFQDLMESGLPFDEAVRLFLEKHPDGTGFTVFRTTTTSGAPIPATADAYDWMLDNEEFLGAFNQLAPWFIPQGDIVEFGPKERRARAHTMATQLRMTRSPRELLDAFYTAEASEDFFDQDELWQMEIMTLDLAGDLLGKKQKEQEYQLWKSQYMRRHPVFAKMMNSAEGKTRRAELLEQARAVMSTVRISGGRYIADPGIVPDTPHQQPLLQMLDALVAYSDAYRNMTNIQAAEATEKRKMLALELYEQTWAIALQHPELMMFWNSNIRPITSDVEMENAILGGRM